MKAARTFFVTLIGLGLAGVLVRCQLLWGPDVNGTMADAAPDRDADAMTMAMPDADPCSMVGYPPQDMGNDPASPELDLVFALSSIDYGLNGTTHALNLDQRCTCPGKDSCIRPAGQMPACDLDGGGDNTMLVLFQYLNVSGIASQDFLNQLLAQGVSGALLRVRKWNGTPTDNTIEVSIYAAIGVDDDAGTDGGRAWRVDRTSVADPMSPDLPAKEKAIEAWIAKGTLVAAFPATTLVVGGSPDAGGTTTPPLRVEFTPAYIVGSIDTTSVKGVLAGVWGAESALKSMEGFKVSDTEYLCGDSGAYAYIASAICARRDISTLGPNESVPCDALSGAIGFTATTARFGSLGDGVDGGHPCGANWMPTCP